MPAFDQRAALGSELDSRNLLIWGATLLALASCIAYLFAPRLAGLAIRWQEPEYSHGYLIPLITLFIIWQRRRRLLVTRWEGIWLGVPLVAFGLAAMLGGKIALSDLPQALAFLLVLAGLGLAALGTSAMRYLWAPLAFLLFALPVPAPFYIKLSTALQLLSSKLGAGLLQWLGISVFLDGNVIDLGVYQLQVAEACSGLRYLFPLVSFGVLCAWLYRAPLWARIVLVLSSLPITVAINSTRIALTGLLIEYGSIELAEGFVHLFEGWAIFLVALALLFGEMWLLARFWTSRGRLMDLLDFDRVSGSPAPPNASRERTATRPAAPLIACLGLLMAAVPAPSILADRAEVIPERPGLVTFPLRLGEWRGYPAALDQETLTALAADDYLLADFTSPDAAAPVNFWVAYYGSQGHRWTHSPKECLPGAGWEFVSLTEIAAPFADPGSAGFALNRALIANGEERMLMYYWYDERGHQFADATWARFYILLDSLRMRRSDGALVRLMTPILPRESVQAADVRLTELFRAGYPHLDRHVGT
jgi:exosortase D (VPLPA-CTERM-specific)